MVSCTAYYACAILCVVPLIYKHYILCLPTHIIFEHIVCDCFDYLLVVHNVLLLYRNPVDLFLYIIL